MIDYSGMVKEFHREHGAFFYQTPTIPTDKTVVLRLRLMLEELAELGTALHERNILETADALADLLYVVHGTAIACGVPIDAVFAEVHRSNMTKPRLDEHGKGGKIAKEGYRPPRLGPILFSDRTWCPNCGREIDRSRVYLVIYDGTKICDCGLTKGELI